VNQTPVLEPTPELFSIPIAVLALIIAGAGFGLSFIALIWQVAKHLLDGGRVKVQLNAGAWEPGFMLLVNRTGKWKLNPKDHAKPDRIEVAQLVVENPGRTPVTIYSPGIAITGDGSKRHRISPRMFPLPDYGSDSAVTDTVVRINPYDRVTFLLDYWSVVPGLKAKAGQRTIVLRGVVEVAGKRWPRRSPRRLAWKIRPSDWSSYKGVKDLSPRTVMFRPFYVSAHGDMEREGKLSRVMLSGVLFEAMKKFEDRPPREEFETALEETAKAYGVEHPIMGMAVWNMYEALDQRAGQLGSWTWRPKPPEQAAEEAPKIEGEESSTKEHGMDDPDSVPEAESGQQNK